MKRIIPILMLVLGSVAFAQSGWYYQTPTSVNSVYFIDNNTIIAVGLGIWKTTDRGESWKGVPPGYDMQANEMFYPLQKVDFYSTLIGYAVGYGGKIVKTVNGGNSWNLKNHNLSTQSTEFVDIAVIDFSTAIAVAKTNTSGGYGSVIIKTTDGGDTWFTVYEEANLYLNDMDFPDQQNGWITGNYNKILKTTDGGNNWIRFELPTSFPLGLSFCLSFKDANNGLISTQNSNYVVRTQDGGNNWETITTGITGNSTSLQYFSNGTAYMMKDGGVLLKSADDGASWAAIGTASYEHHNQIKFSSTSIGISYTAFQGSSSANFDYCITNNSGQDWEFFNYNPGDIYSFDQNNSWATNYKVENGQVSFLRTFNGTTWNFIKSNSALDDVKSFGAFQFLNLNEGFAFANYRSAPNTYSYALVKTTNSGVDWSTIMASSGLMDYYFVNSQYGWVVLSNGKILKTLDHAATWGEQTSGVNTLLSDVYFVDENTGWISGFSGVLLRTTNGGLLWSRISIPGYSDVDFYGLNFYDSNNGYMVGRRNSAGIVLKTNDGGVNWVDITPADLPTYLYGNQFEVKGPGEVYLLAYDDRIFRTGDGGSSWQIINYPGAGFNNGGFSVVNSSRIYVQADGILFTDNGGVSSVEKLKTVSIPNEFILSQNYPNPFNPSTTICFSLPPDFFGKVNLTIMIFSVIK